MKQKGISHVLQGELRLGGCCRHSCALRSLGSGNAKSANDDWLWLGMVWFRIEENNRHILERTSDLSRQLSHIIAYYTYVYIPCWSNCLGVTFWGSTGLHELKWGWSAPQFIQSWGQEQQNNDHSRALETTSMWPRNERGAKMGNLILFDG